MIPTVIYDDFFEYPDQIVEYANTLDYGFGQSNYPGIRSKLLSEINPDLYFRVCSKIVKLFYPVVDPESIIEAEISFQKIKPLHTEKYHNKNRGWIHRDTDAEFGGIVYLNKNPESDTGTSVYESIDINNLYYNQYQDSVKERFYKGEDISDEEYNRGFISTEDRWKETIKVENKYNRMFMFPNTKWHGVKTYGSGENERLTLVFFITMCNIRKVYKPLNR
tara:strand:+ start:724 stop:1386 length:663 start_codon:yes stop_codon:yes gene_type:complete